MANISDFTKMMNAMSQFMNPQMCNKADPEINPLHKLLL